MEQNQTSPAGFREKIAHLWYYYKWVILVVALAAAFLLFTLINGLQYRAPDANLLYLGGKTLNTSQIDHIYSVMKKNILKEDYNQNGSVDADLISLRPRAAGKDEYGDVVYDPDFFSEYEHELYSGDTVIFIVESKDLYERMLIDDLLVPLEDILGERPDNAHDAFSFRMGDLDLSKLDAFKVFSKDAYLCVRQARVVNGKVTQGALKAQEYNRKVFAEMVNYQFFVSDNV